MKKIKQMLLTLGVVGCAVLARAQEESVTTAMTNIETELQGYISAAIPLVTSLAVAMLGVWIIPKALRWIRSGVGR